MPFGMVSGFGRGMGVLDGGDNRRRRRAVLGMNLGRSIVTNGTFRRSCSQITLGTTCHRNIISSLRSMHLFHFLDSDR